MAFLQIVSIIEMLQNLAGAAIPECPACDWTEEQVKLLKQNEFHKVRVLLNSVRVQLVTELFFGLVEKSARYNLTDTSTSSTYARLALELQGAFDSINLSNQIWDKIINMKNELIYTVGSLSKKEIKVFASIFTKEYDVFVGSVTKLHLHIEYMQAVLEKMSRNEVAEVALRIKCPITGQLCTKEIPSERTDVFVGLQFCSDYYCASNLKELIGETLRPYGLSPFFADEHFEPIHISCEICHKLQKVSICIFEISDSNPNVMFELGLAYMLGKVSILIAKNNSRGTKISDIAGLHRVQYDGLVDCGINLAKCFDDSSLIQLQISNPLGGVQSV